MIIHHGSVASRPAGKPRGPELLVRLPVSSRPVSARVEPAAPLRPRRVLVIEDDVDAAECLSMALELDGHEVFAAHDGLRGLERARELTPDVVLCDIGLPGMDGYAVAKAIRRLPAICDTFLVALTGYALPDDQRRATEAGFDAHVIKPASIDAMEEVLARAPARELARGAPPLS